MEREEDEQPKDYEEFTDFLRDEYSYLTWDQKIIYRIQDHLIKVMLFVFMAGIFTGAYFDMFQMF
jgi:hypothetical protein